MSRIGRAHQRTVSDPAASAGRSGANTTGIAPMKPMMAATRIAWCGRKRTLDIDPSLHRILPP
jgi:hypothetical protein